MVHSLKFKNQFLNITLSILAMHLLRKIYFVGCILLLLIFLNLLFYWQIIREEDLQKNEKQNCLKVDTLRVTHQTGPLMINESDVLKFIFSTGLPLNLDFEGFKNHTGTHRFIVPNIVHYIRFQQTRFTFYEYICLLSAYINHRPNLIIIHTDVIKYGGFKGFILAKPINSSFTPIIKLV
jgi:hypothetical protein